MSMIDQALLDVLDTLPADDAAQAHAKQWAQRVRELRERQTELRERALAAFDTGDEQGCLGAVAEHDAVSRELSSLSHTMGDFVSRLRPSTETMQ
jgi:phage shock protein A